MTGPREWRHAEECIASSGSWKTCTCGLSALREAVAAGDPLAVLEAVGMGGTLVRTERYWRVSTPPVGPPARDYLYRVVRPLPDAPEVSP